MKTWKRALALVLALVMALSLVALPSFAAGGDESAGDTGMPYINGQGGTVEQNGLVVSKTIKKGENGQFLLTLEAYATGSTTTTTSTKPVDIVLVLDVSGSMKDSISDKYDYYETYSIDTDGTYYYKDNNGQYQQAYYCDGEYYSWGWKSHHTPGWYTKDHQYLGQCQGESGMPLTPKTSASDSNTSHTQFYTRTESTTKKIDALKSAVNGFIDSVAAKSADSQIAIVKFAGDKRDIVGNDTYKKGGYTYNYSQIVQNLTTVDETGASSLKTAVNGLIAAGTTLANYGMEHAQTIINRAKDNGRQKVVVMFTDGEPNGIEKVSGFEEEVANSAIANSKSIKAAGATVYTIGCFGTLTGDTKTKVDTYMNYVSSNYPEATNMNNGGNKANPANYYKTVSSAADLNNIFQDISHTVGGTTVTLGRTSVLRDVISDSFTLPEGYKDGDIKAYSVSCTGKTGDSYTWDSTHDTEYTATIAADKKTINVTGFDYAANWVDQLGVNGSQSHGKKLVVQIPIVPETTAYGDCDTNGPASGIYATGVDGEEPVQTFPSPKVYIPYFTVVHVASTVNDQGHNEGKKTGETYHPVWCNRPFNLTSVVTENYLYGGTFNEETCTTVHKDVQEQGNPMELNPTEKATYYIWEVPDTYLRPFAFWVSSHQPKGWTVTQMYLLSEVDRLLYRDAGLYVKFGDNEGTYISSNCSELTEGTDVNNNNKATVYQRLEYFKEPNLKDVVETWYLQKGKVKKQEVGLTLNENANPTDSQGQVVDDGYITGHRLLGNEFTDFQNQVPVTYKAYWVTLDGVHVEGVRSRTYTFQENQHDPAKNPDSGKRIEPVYKYVENVSTQTTLALRASMLVNESEPAVENVNVTVVDAAKTYELTVSAGTGVRDQVAYQAPAGKVFAGWFADQAYTTPADLDQVTQDTTIYAKYVSDSYLDLAYSRIGLFRLRGVTLISAVDNPANYQASGIMVNGQKLDVSYASRYRIFKTPANLFGAARDAKLMLADKSLSGTGDLEVTPYWITLDGTEVHGSAHTLHYNTRTIWE